MIKKIFIIVFLISTFSFAQEGNTELEVYIIDSYVTPKAPHKIVISFFTSKKVKSKIRFEGNEDFIVSNEFIEDHKFELLLNKLQYDSTTILFEIEIEDSIGNKIVSEKYELFLSEEYKLEIKNKSYLNQMCLGALIYFIPSPTIFVDGGSTSFSLTKEIPILSFYDKGYNYPSSYFGLEYSYVFNQKNKSYLRFGYKYIFQTNFIKYISPGLNGVTNFNGFNGVSPEITFGLFDFYETFTFYARYRFNFKPDSTFENFHEVSIGLFTSVISLNF
jgi:hypothetical protein